MPTPSSATLCAQRSHSTSRTPLFTVALLLFGVCSAVHLVNHLVGESEGVVDSVSQIGLMALLALVLLAATRDLTPRPRLVTLAVGALFFSWLGDTIPRFLDGDTGFMAMIGGFFFAQVFYAIAFWPYRRRSILRRPLLVVPYLVAVIAMVAVCWSGAGALLPAVVAYALVIVVMAILATGVEPLAAVGGVVFLLSDSLIALRSFADANLPAHGFLVMLTYIVGQCLLVWGIVRLVRSDAKSRAGSPVK